ncbi:protein kinase family protein [Evansella sp. AB-rgal1]|uniref:protein kinase family protein n=1 Tax=Evansella sp. AB-rgal1 TaxID=3242696 RepID=UPI00359D218B
MKTYNELAQSVTFIKVGSSIILKGSNPLLDCVGKGRSAYAFRIKSTNKVLKVFFPPFSHLAEEEAEIYIKLQGISYYSRLHDYGDNYLVVDYIEGKTLFQCLVQGVSVKKEYLLEADKALKLAKQRGLNPSDIHLRNIFITKNGTIKIIDVARYRQTKHCSQWEDIKLALEKYYLQQGVPVKVPTVFLNVIACLYKKNYLRRYVTKLPSNARNKKQIV